MRCEQCEVVNINGVRCHETGCPEYYKDEKRECKNCGSEFTPEHSRQTTCDHSCYVAYNGLDCDCEECTEFWPADTNSDLYGILV